MKLYREGDHSPALCHRDGRATATFGYRDVPFSDGRGIARGILVGSCNTCGDVILIPAQSTPAVANARSAQQCSFEVNLPSVFVELLDAAAARITPLATPDFRKRLFFFYVNRYAHGQETSAELAKLARRSAEVGAGGPAKRLSMKLSAFANERIETVLQRSSLTRTELIKCVALKVGDEIVLPERPRHIGQLTVLADILYA